MRVMIDLVVNHTSDEHPWFQSARSDPASPYRDWYVWSKEEPSDLRQGMVFPGYQDTTWTFDEEAGAWYYHRFYDFQPDLNMDNPRVRQEIEKIIGFWLQLGVAGFRLDAAPFIIELTAPGDPNPRQDFSWLRRPARQLAVATRRRRDPRRGQRRARPAPRVLRRRPPPADAVQLHPQPAHVPGPGPRRGRTDPAGPGRDAGAARHLPVGDVPAQPRRGRPRPPRRPRARRGVRRVRARSRDAALRPGHPPAAGADARQRPPARSRWPTPCSSACPARPSSATATRSAWARTSRCRSATPSAPRCSGATGPTAGSPPTRRKRDLRRPVITGGDFGYETVNVEAQQRDPASLLCWFQRALLIAPRVPRVRRRHVHLRRHRRPVGARPRPRRAERRDARRHQPRRRGVTIDLGPQDAQEGDPIEVFADRDYPRRRSRAPRHRHRPYGYRWIRLRRSIGARAGSSLQH